MRQDIDKLHDDLDGAVDLISQLGGQIKRLTVVVRNEQLRGTALKNRIERALEEQNETLDLVYSYVMPSKDKGDN